VTNKRDCVRRGELNTANNAASDRTTIGQRPDLAIAKSHAGTFHPGDTGAVYTMSSTTSGAATDAAP